MNKSSANSHHIPELDGIRALAIFLVLTRHASLLLLSINDKAPIFPLYEYDLFTFFLNGWVGVDLFFVLSGYLISSQFFKDTPPDLSKYALRRILRIVPAYYTVLILCAMGAFPFYDIPAGDNILQSTLLHLLFLQDYTGADINSSFWSLGVEEKFYILMPLIVAAILALQKKIGDKGTLFFLCIIGIFGIFLRTSIFAVDYANIPQSALKPIYDNNYRHPAHCCIQPFIFGIIIAFLKFRTTYNLQKQAHVIFYAGFISFLIYMSSYNFLSEITWFDLSLQPAIVSFFMFTIVLGTVFKGAPKFFQTPFMIWGSKMSYMFYLVHVPLLPVTYFATAFITHADRVTPLFICTFIGVFVTILVVISTILHEIVEKPALKMKDKI